MYLLKKEHLILQIKLFFVKKRGEIVRKPENLLLYHYRVSVLPEKIFALII